MRVWRHLKRLGQWLHLAWRHRLWRADAAAVAAFAEQGGPVFIKLAQFLSMRADVVGLERAQALARLQDQVRPWPFADMEPVLIEAYGLHWRERFTSFDEHCIASASLAQVYRAVLPSGDTVALKLLRPGVGDLIDQDLSLIALMVRLLCAVSSRASYLRLNEVIVDWTLHLQREQNLSLEAGQLKRLQLSRTVKQGWLRVPKLYQELSSAQVLVLQWCQGTRLDDLAELDRRGFDRTGLAERGLKVFFVQAFEEGFFHADLHPGNLWVDEQGQLLALDFGICGVLSDIDRRTLLTLNLAFVERDFERMARLHAEWGWGRADINASAMGREIEQLALPLLEAKLAHLSLAQLMGGLFMVFKRHGVYIQPHIALLHKTMMQVETLGANLAPELDLWQQALPLIKHALRQQLSPRMLLKRLAQEWPYLSNDVPLMARHLRQHIQESQRQRLSQQQHQEQVQRWLKWLFVLVAVIGLSAF